MLLKVEEAISRKSTKTLVDSMAKMLLKGDEKKSARSTGNDESKVGLLIDWLQMLDPELVQATLENRLGLLFAQMDKQTSNAATKITRFLLKMTHLLLKYEQGHKFQNN